MATRKKKFQFKSQLYVYGSDWDDQNIPVAVENMVELPVGPGGEIRVGVYVLEKVVTIKSNLEEVEE